MKKNLKRTLAKVMAVALTVALAGTAAPDADAAKKAKLSAKSVTVVKGKSKKVTIKIGKKNAKKKDVKKLSVKVDKKKIATAKASGKTAVKVTGKKKGSAKVTVSVTLKGQKKAAKLTLKVKVKNATPATAAPTAAPTTAPTTAPTAAATASAPAGNGGQGGGQGDGGQTQTTSPSIQTQAPAVESEAVDIKNIQLGGEMKEFAKSFKVENGAATLKMSENATYDHVYTYFDYELPEGAALSDILAVRFDYEATGGDCGNKNVCLVAGDPATFPMKGLKWDYNTKKPGDGAASVGFNPNGTATDKDTDSIRTGNGKTPLLNQELEVTTKELNKVVTGNTVRFSVYVHIQGVKSDLVTEYTLSNIKVMVKKGKKGTNPGTSTTINNVSKAEPVAAAPKAATDTMQIDIKKGEIDKEITLVVPKATIEDYGVTITDHKAEITDENLQDVLTVTKDATNNTYTIKLKTGYTLPEKTEYVEVPVKIQVELNTGGALEKTFTIVVGDNSKLDVEAVLKTAGLEKGTYELIDLTKLTKFEMYSATATLETITELGVDAVTVTPLGAYNAGAAVPVDKAKTVKKLAIIANPKSQLVIKSTATKEDGWSSDKYPFQNADGSVKTEVIDINCSQTAINIAAGEAKAFTIYAIAVVYEE